MNSDHNDLSKFRDAYLDYLEGRSRRASRARRSAGRPAPRS